MTSLTSITAGLVAALALVALVPSAAAGQQICTPDSTTCVTTHSYGEGAVDCSSSASAQDNIAGVFTSGTPAGRIGVSASTTCYNNDLWGTSTTHSRIAVEYFVSGPAGYGWGGVVWRSYSTGGASNCAAFEYHNNSQTGFGTTPIGCPAGPPPPVPALLP